MKSRFWILLLCLHCLRVCGAAQNPAKRQLVLQVSNGGFVAFRSETSRPEARLPDGKSLAALLYAQAFAGENRIIHRVLTDAQQNVVFGYDLWVSADPITKKFSLAVLPGRRSISPKFPERLHPTATEQLVRHVSKINHATNARRRRRRLTRTAR